MKTGRALIGIFQKMRIKNLSEVRFKKNSTPWPWQRRKNLENAGKRRNFLRNGR